MTLNGDIVMTKNEIGNLQIIPVSDQKWNVNLVEGQEYPELQGWYSEEYNKYEPNPTTVYSTRIENSETFVWLLYPSERTGKKASIEVASVGDKSMTVQINVQGETDKTVTVPIRR